VSECLQQRAATEDPTSTVFGQQALQAAAGAGAVTPPNGTPGENGTPPPDNGPDGGAPPPTPTRDVTPDDPCLFCGATTGCRITEDDSAAGCFSNLGDAREVKTSERTGREYGLYYAADIAKKRKARAEAERLADVRRFLDLLHPPADGRVIELRVLSIETRYGRPHEAAGYFRDMEKAAKAALSYDKANCAGVYVTLNPPDPDCYARSPEKVKDHLKPTTSDTNITRRAWLVIDADPKRPAGVPATDEHLGAALAFAGRVKDMLATRFGWPLPVEAMSGNGVYLLYKIDLPNDAESERLVSKVLKALNVIMADEEAEAA
jgi:hypothetical protein